MERRVNREEQFDKNLELAREFFLELLDQPVESWPESGTTILFTPADDENLTRANVAMLRAMQERHPGEVGKVMRVTGARASVPSQARSIG